MSEPYKTKKKDIFKMSEETTSLNLDFGKAFGDSFGLLKDNLCLLIVSGLISMLLSTFCFLLIGAMMMGMFFICDRLVAGDETKPQIGDMFKGFSFFVPGLVLTIFGVLGCVACYIGVFITMPVALLGMLRILDKGVTIGEAVKFGFDMIFKRKQWMFVLLVFVAGILSSLGFVLCGVGVFLTLPLYYLAIACGYRQLCPKA